MPKLIIKDNAWYVVIAITSNKGGTDSSKISLRILYHQKANKTNIHSDKVLSMCVGSAFRIGTIFAKFDWN